MKKKKEKKIIRDKHFERHLELCRRVYYRMLAENSWPWRERGSDDSRESEDVVESKENSNDL